MERSCQLSATIIACVRSGVVPHWCAAAHAATGACLSSYIEMRRWAIHYRAASDERHCGPVATHRKSCVPCRARGGGLGRGAKQLMAPSSAPACHTALLPCLLCHVGMGRNTEAAQGAAALPWAAGLPSLAETAPLLSSPALPFLPATGDAMASEGHRADPPHKARQTASLPAGQCPHPAQPPHTGPAGRGPHPPANLQPQACSTPSRRLVRAQPRPDVPAI